MKTNALKRKEIAASISLGLLLVLSIGLSFLFSRPALGRIKDVKLKTSEGTPAKIAVEGKSFQVIRPGNYIQKDTGVNTGNSFIFARDGLHRIQIVIAADSLGSHDLVNEPSYKMRSLRTDKYRLEQRVLAGKTIPIFLTLDATEQVAYITDGQRVGTIAIIAADPDIVPVTVLNQMIQSWTWK